MTHATNAWSRLPAVGTGPQKLAYLVFDPSLGAHGTIIAFSYDGGLWHGTLSDSGGTIPAPFPPSQLRIIGSGRF